MAATGRLDAWWVEQELFDRDPADDIRDALGGELHVGRYPGGGIVHTLWWRERDVRHAEVRAQVCYVARIVAEAPVLSLGIYIEKGYGNLTAAGGEADLVMDRTWDWPGLVKLPVTRLNSTLKAVARLVGRPVLVRIAAREIVAGRRLGEVATCYALVKGSWFRRQEGQVRLEDLVHRPEDLDGRAGCWVDVSFVCDFSPRRSRR